MEFLLAPVLFIGLVLFVAWPLLKEGEEPDFVEPSEFDLALEEKERAIANLKDVEMDFRMGKLSDEDFRQLKQDLEQRAVTALQKVESLQKKGKPKRK